MHVRVQPDFVSRGFYGSGRHGRLRWLAKPDARAGVSPIRAARLLRQRPARPAALVGKA